MRKERKEGEGRVSEREGRVGTGLKGKQGKARKVKWEGRKGREVKVREEGKKGEEGKRREGEGRR